MHTPASITNLSPCPSGRPMSRRGTLAIVLAASLAAPFSWSAQTQSAPAQAAQAGLDLRVPRITELYSAEQLSYLLAGSAADIEEVEVEGSREPAPQFTPDVWRGLLAPIWAVLNPTQAWRIFAPLPPDQARALDEPFDATSGYLEPAAMPPIP